MNEVRELFDKFRTLTEDDQLRFLRLIGDGEHSGLSLRVRIETVDAAREIATKVAAREKARNTVLDQKLRKSKRPPDSRTVQLANAVRALKVEQRLSWRQTAKRIKEEHPDWFPPSVLIENVEKRCQKAFRRIVELKKS